MAPKNNVTLDTLGPIRSQTTINQASNKEAHTERNVRGIEDI